MVSIECGGRMAGDRRFDGTCLMLTRQGLRFDAYRAHEPMLALRAGLQGMFGGRGDAATG